ncbi:OmpA family protein [Seleniivibrio woodruffii]|uniref:OmpA family protein n=2 Tax=Seleniivibrio woodruffii TaxID=1078050 RepID=A0A4R1KB70_9BACT|nr:OmpA family protein [Seleniivibrio woodruffii]TVZ35149.1 OmpA family protein [Seleniivibrio woodruffii]
MTTTTGIYLRKFLSVLVIFAVLYGGNSFAAERSFFRVIVAKPDSNVTTQMRVWAESEEEARENVALNGWQILSIEQSTPGAPYNPSTAVRGADSGAKVSPSDHLVNVTKIGEGDIQPIGKLTVKDGENVDFKLKPGPCQTLTKLVVNGEQVEVSDSYSLKNVKTDTYVVAFFDKNGRECDSNGIKDKDLKEIAIIYFDLGKFSTTVKKDTAELLKTLSKNKKYVIIGHTDDVRVIPNVEYKDNMELSIRRAGFAKARLLGNGIPSSSIKLMGMGPAYPVAPNKPEGQPLNRRAVIYERR